MICPCGGQVNESSYVPVVKEKGEAPVRQATLTCSACGRRRVEIWTLDEVLVEARG